MNIVVLQKPIITEKTMKLANVGVYTFAVSKDANKQSIAKAVTDKFSVKVESVRIINVKGGHKTQRKVRNYYQTSRIKKAIVQVGKGEKISIFDAEIPKEAEVITAGEMEPIKERKNILRGTKVKVEKKRDSMQKTKRKVNTGK